MKKKLFIIVQSLFIQKRCTLFAHKRIKTADVIFSFCNLFDSLLWSEQKKKHSHRFLMLDNRCFNSFYINTSTTLFCEGIFMVALDDKFPYNTE